MEWLNEPPEWRAEESRLWVTTGLKTDFWRRTHYGFTRDNGHFYYRIVDRDFTVKVQIAAEYAALYDQAGLMIRIDAEHWIKAGVEFTDGSPQFSVVVTNKFSDWSVYQIADPLEFAWLRATRHGEAVRVDASLDGETFQMLRLAYLPDLSPVQVGLMCCSPERAGLKARFADFVLTDPIRPELHT